MLISGDPADAGERRPRRPRGVPRLDRRFAVRRWLVTHLASPLRLTQHPDQHRSERSVLLAVDQ